MIFLLGVDVISGTPVIDIKPYIPQYDSPWCDETRLCGEGLMSMKQREQQQCAEDSPTGVAEQRHCADDLPTGLAEQRHSAEDSPTGLAEQRHCAEDSPASLADALPDAAINKCGNFDDGEAQNVSSALTFCLVSDTSDNVVKPEVSVAKWVTDSLQPTLSVIFTARAERQLKQFDSMSSDPRFQLRHLSDADELRSALIAVLQADPRSVYRRKHCHDQLYYVTVDIAHVTCWFDDDTVEVLKVQSIHTLTKQNDSM